MLKLLTCTCLAVCFLSLLKFQQSDDLNGRDPVSIRLEREKLSVPLFRFSAIRLFFQRDVFDKAMASELLSKELRDGGWIQGEIGEIRVRIIHGADDKKDFIKRNLIDVEESSWVLSNSEKRYSVQVISEVDSDLLKSKGFLDIKFSADNRGTTKNFLLAKSFELKQVAGSVIWKEKCGDVVPLYKTKALEAEQNKGAKQNKGARSQKRN